MASSRLVAIGRSARGSSTPIRRRSACIALAGGLAFVAGLVYTAIRQLRVRGVLPPERYRGPSVFILLALVLVVATVLTAPFTRRRARWSGGEGELTLLGSVVLLVSTQVGLLVVSWLFVYRPHALAALPSFPGRDPARALRAASAGASWPGSARRRAVPRRPRSSSSSAGRRRRAAEQAIAVLDPWLVVVAIVILAPIAEEVFFRGVVFNAWLREAGRRWAFIGSAALFAAIHLSLVSLLPIFLLGLALAWVYERTRQPARADRDARGRQRHLGRPRAARPLRDRAVPV